MSRQSKIPCNGSQFRIREQSFIKTFNTVELGLIFSLLFKGLSTESSSHRIKSNSLQDALKSRTIAPPATSTSQTISLQCTSIDKSAPTAVCHLQDGFGEDIILSCIKCPTDLANLKQCPWLCTLPSGQSGQSVLECADIDLTNSLSAVGGNITYQQCLSTCSSSLVSQISSSALTASSSKASTAMTTTSGCKSVNPLAPTPRCTLVGSLAAQTLLCNECPIDATDLERCP